MGSFAERFVSTSDGLSLFVRDYGPEGGERAAPVVCLHGLTRNSADFETVAPRIAGLGRRVLALDVRGRGRSASDPQWQRYQPPTYAGDVVQVMAALNVPKAVFVGTSMGGLITMLLAVMAPERIAAAILNDVGPVIDPAGIARIGGYVGKTGPFPDWKSLAETLKASQSIAFPDADDAAWEAFARRTGRERADGQIEFAYDPAIAKVFAEAPAGPAPDIRPLFAALARVPVLVLRGALSDILSPDGVEEMRKLKADLDVAEIPRVGHAPMLDEPASWAAIEAFLRRVG